MARNWIDYFGLLGDPFSLSPPRESEEFTRLFVQTQAIIEDIDPIADYFESSAASIRLLFGERGSGKSTILLYINYCLRKKGGKILPIYIYQQLSDEPIVEDPKYGIGSLLIWQILREILRGIKTRFPHIHKQEKPNFDRWEQLLQLSDSEAITRLPLWQQSFNILVMVLKVVKKHNILTFIGIDNYDKLPEELALRFLSQNTAQPLFEELLAAGTTIIFSLKRSWRDRISKDDDLSYLGNHITVSNLNPQESTELLDRRIRWKSRPDFDLNVEDIFESDALYNLTIKSGGIPREIVRLAKIALTSAFRKNTRIIDVKLIDEIYEKEGSSAKRYYEIIESTPSNTIAFQKLTSFCETIEDIEELRLLLEVVKQVFNKTYTSSAVGELDKLRKLRIVEYNPEAQEPKIVLRTDINELFRSIEKVPLSLNPFIEWISSKGIATVQIPLIDEYDTTSKFESLIHLESSDKIKKYLQDALGKYKNLFRIQANEDYDTTLLIEAMWDVFLKACRAFYSLENPRKTQEADENSLSKWLGEVSFNSQYFFEDLKLKYNFRLKRPLAKDKTDELTLSFDHELLQILEHIEKILLTQQKEKDEITTIRLSSRDYLDNSITLALGQQPCALFVFDAEIDPMDFSMTFWRTLSRKKAIYGVCIARDNLKNRKRFLDVYTFANRKIFYFPKHIKPLLEEHAFQVFRDPEFLPMKLFSSAELSSALIRLKNSFNDIKTIIIRPIGENEVCGQEWELNFQGNVPIMNVFPKTRPLFLIRKQELIELPDNDAELIQLIISARRALNLSFERKHKKKILHQDEGAMFNIKSSCSTETEFTSRISALAALVGLLDVNVLDSCLPSSDVKILSKGSSIDRLEIFLQTLYPNYDDSIIQSFRTIMTLRSKKAPIHRDDSRFLKALEYFGLPPEFPPDWNKLWKICVSNYIMSLRSLTEVIR